MEYIDNLIRMDAINFWRTEYTKRKLLQDFRLFFTNNDDMYNTIKQKIDFLIEHQDSDLGENVIRYTLYAMISKQYLGGSDYDINHLNDKIINLYEHLLYISLHYGYTADKLFEGPTNGLDIIKYIRENGKIPSSVPAFHSLKEDSFIHIITKFVTIELMNLQKTTTKYEYYPVGTKESVTELLNQRATEIYNNTLDMFEQDCNYSNKDITEKIIEKAFYTCLREWPKATNNLIVSWDEKIKNNFIETCKKIYPVSFNIKSNLSRAQGLYLWDTAFFTPEKTIAKAINELRENMPVSNKSENGGSSDSYYNKLHSNTKKCINEGSVLHI